MNMNALGAEAGYLFVEDKEAPKTCIICGNPIGKNNVKIKTHYGRSGPAHSWCEAKR